MMKNSRKLLFVLTMIILLVAVSTVSAVDEDNSPAVMDDVQLDTVSTQQTQSIATNNVADKNMESSPVATCDREDSSIDKNIGVETRTVKNDDPESGITITPDNFDEYISEELLTVEEDSVITFTGEFNDKGIINIETSGIVITGDEAVFSNVNFVLIADNIELSNLVITNTETEYPITNMGDGNIITDNTIEIRNSEDKTAAIYNRGSDTFITNNILVVSGPANNIDFDFEGNGIADTQAILLEGGDGNQVLNNEITIDCSGVNQDFGTIDAITNSKEATNTEICENIITLSGANFNYGIDCLGNVENITITDNIIEVTGQRYCDGVQVGNGAKGIVISNNNITCICMNTTEMNDEEALTFGIIFTSMGGGTSENITITDNNVELVGTVNYGIELYKVKTTQICDNNFTITGPFSMGIGIGYSPNSIVTGNTIIIDGDTTIPINHVTQEFKPETVGMRIQNGTQNVTIENNSITTNDI